MIHSRKYHAPVRRFFYHNFNDWLRQMLCRPGMEDLMDRNPSPSQASSGVMEDIWDVVTERRVNAYYTVMTNVSK